MQPRWRSLKVVLISLVALVMLGGITSGAVAGTRQQEWQGLTAQRLPLSFTVVSTSRGIFIPNFELSGLLTCEITGDQVGVLAGFSGFAVKVEQGQFRFDFVTADQAMHWSGSISGSSAAGLLELKLPALTPKETAEVCSSGSQAWVAHPATSGSASTVRPDVKITFVHREDGTVRRTETNG
jgi:hypothetical protein